MKLRLFILMMLLGTSQVLAQDFEPSLNEFISETQFTSDNPDRIELLWWIPSSYWDIVLANESTPGNVEQIKEVLKPYFLLAAVDGEIGPFGGVTYVAEKELREKLRLVDDSRMSYSPIPNEEVAPDAKNLVLIMKPMIAGTMGPMGENLHFLFFPAHNENGDSIADEKSEGAFAIVLDERKFRVRLPLGSLLRKNRCPVDGEMMNGAWKYCPWHGTVLKKNEAEVDGQ